MYLFQMSVIAKTYVTDYVLICVASAKEFVSGGLVT